METATLVGGCFWCLEAAFLELRGVSDVVSGYTGGTTVDPTYEQVSSGRTGHAEAVRVTFDPLEISYSDLLEVFFTIHDPTTKDRQGADVGSQYRSAVYYHSAEQLSEVEAMIARLSAEELWPGPIVTDILPAGPFYEAEEYHQRYFEKHPHQPYCMVVVAPKLAKMRKRFSERLLRG